MCNSSGSQGTMTSRTRCSWFVGATLPENYGGSDITQGGLGPDSSRTGAQRLESSFLCQRATLPGYVCD